MTTNTLLAGPSTALAARAIIRTHSKSFSLASLLLAPIERRRAEALYAYCRRADDAIDLAPASQMAARLRALRRELDAVYAGHALREPTLAEFQRVVFETRIPRDYPEALLQGFALDAEGARYETVLDLYHYCWCVAGSVGAMMCHVLGVRRERAVVNLDPAVPPNGREDTLHAEHEPEEPGELQLRIVQRTRCLVELARARA